jgi:hypothetical protein
MYTVALYRYGNVTVFTSIGTVFTAKCSIKCSILTVNELGFIIIVSGN